MAKRGASEYITKDGIGAMPINNVPPDRGSRPATAAQLAARKLKAPKGRTNMTTPARPSFASVPSSNVIANSMNQQGQQNQQIQQPSGFGSANGMPNFSGSQSFPPPTSSSTFNFAPPQSSSFTFGAQTGSNPFSNIGNNTTSSSAPLFGGQTNGTFNAQSDGDTMMESPKKTFGTGFSAQNAAAATLNNPFSFAQSSQSGAQSMFNSAKADLMNGATFGQSQAASQPSNNFGAFGSQKTEAPKPQGFSPGNSSQPAANPFGQPAANTFGQPATTSSTSSSFFPSSAQPAPNFFGQAATTSAAASSVFAPSTAAPGFSNNLFGQQATTSGAPNSLFGQATSAAASSSVGGPFSTLFGQSSATLKAHDGETASDVPKPVFSIAPSTSQPIFSFSTTPNSEVQTSSSIFVPSFASSTTGSSAQGSSTPKFSFGAPAGRSGETVQNGTAHPALPDANATSTDSGVAKPSGYNFTSNSSVLPATDSSSGTLFSLPKAVQAGDTNGGGLFGRVSRPQEAPSGGPVEAATTETIDGNGDGLFGRVTRPELPSQESVYAEATEKSLSDEHASDAHDSNTSNASGLFGRISQPEGPTESLNTQRPQSPTKTTSTPGFGGFQPRASTQKPALPANSPFGNIFAGASTTKSAAQQEDNDRESTSTSHETHSTSADASAKQAPLPMPAVALLSSATPAASTSSQSVSREPPTLLKSASDAAETPSSSASIPKIKMRSHGSSITPDVFDGDERLDHDRYSRLRNLNTNFQKTIAKLDPASQDFGTIVRHYVAQCESIGASVGLYQRNKAGMKRKADDGSADEEAQNTSKRAKLDALSSQPANRGLLQSINVAGGNAPASMQPIHTLKTQSTFQPGHNSSASSSSTSNTIKSMIPPSNLATTNASSAPAAVNTFGNPFAETPKVGTAVSASEIESAAAASNPFASQNASSKFTSESQHLSSSMSSFKPRILSTTPAKSPPKKPAFEMPKFGGGGATNFLESFAKQAAASALEMEEEAKRKRKAEEFDSDEDEDAEFNREWEEEQRVKREKLEAIAKAGKSGFQPVLGGVENPTTKEKVSKSLSAKTGSGSTSKRRSSMDGDSDKAYEEKQRAKRNKLESGKQSGERSGSSGFEPVLGAKDSSTKKKLFGNALSPSHRKTMSRSSSPPKISFSSATMRGFDVANDSDKETDVSVTAFGKSPDSPVHAIDANESTGDFEDSGSREAGSDQDHKEAYVHGERPDQHDDDDDYSYRKRYGPEDDESHGHGERSDQHQDDYYSYGEVYGPDDDEVIEYAEYPKGSDQGNDDVFAYGENGRYVQKVVSDSEDEHEEEQLRNEEEEHEHEEGDSSESEDMQAAMSRPVSKGSLFDRIEPNPNHKPGRTANADSQSAPQQTNGTGSKPFEANTTPNGPTALSAFNKSFKPAALNGLHNSGAVTSTPSAPEMSPFTPINGSKSNSDDHFASAGSASLSTRKENQDHISTSEKTNGGAFSFTPKSSTQAPTQSQSVLFGGSSSFSSGAVPGEGLFGSRPSTPSNVESSGGSIFGGLGKTPNFSGSQGNNTWRAGTPIKFGTPDKDGPTVNVTAATPPAKDDSLDKKPFGNLFGPSPSKPGANSLGSVGFNFGGPSKLTASPMLAPSILSSAVSSRATSPYGTDNESVNTDTAEDHSDDPQSNLMSSRPGEENEDVLFEGRTKAMKLISEQEAKAKKLEPGYNTQGVGQLRVLKDKETGKTRILLRAEPGSNIVINTSLVSSMAYKSTSTTGTGAVKFGIPTPQGIEHWVVKIKTTAMAEELASVLEANKGGN